MQIQNQFKTNRQNNSSHSLQINKKSLKLASNNIISNHTKTKIKDNHHLLQDRCHQPSPIPIDRQNKQNYQGPIKKLINNINMQDVLNNINKILCIKSTKIQQKYRQKYSTHNNTNNTNIYHPLELQLTSTSFLSQRHKYHLLLQNHHINLAQIRDSTSKNELTIFECLQSQHLLLYTTMKVFTEYVMKQCQEKGLLMQVLISQHMYLYEGLLQYMDVKLKNDLRQRIKVQSQIENQLGEQIQNLKVQLKNISFDKDRKWRNMFMLIKDNRILRRTRGKLMRQFQASRNREKNYKQNIIQLTKQIQRYKLLTFSSYNEEDGLQKWLKNMSSLIKIQRYIQKQPRKAKRVLQYQLQSLQISEMQDLPQKIQYIIKSIQQAEQLVDYYQDLNDLIIPSKLLLNNYTQTDLQLEDKFTNTPIFRQQNRYCQARLRDLLENNLGICSKVCFFSKEIQRRQKSNDMLSLSRRKVSNMSSSRSQRLFSISTKNNYYNQDSVQNHHNSNLRIVKSIQETIVPTYIAKSFFGSPNQYYDSKFLKKLEMSQKQVQIVFNGLKGFTNIYSPKSSKINKIIQQKPFQHLPNNKSPQKRYTTQIQISKLQNSFNSSSQTQKQLSQLQLSYQNPSKNTHPYLLKPEKSQFFKRYSHNAGHTLSSLQSRLKRISHFGSGSISGLSGDTNSNAAQDFYQQFCQQSSKDIKNSSQYNCSQQKRPQNLHINHQNILKDEDIISQQHSYISDNTSQNIKINPHQNNLHNAVPDINFNKNTNININSTTKIQKLKTQPNNKPSIKGNMKKSRSSEKPVQSRNSFNIIIKQKANSKQKQKLSQKKPQKQSISTPHNTTTNIRQQTDSIIKQPNTILQKKRGSYRASIFNNATNSQQRNSIINSNSNLNFNGNTTNSNLEYQSEIENQHYTDRLGDSYVEEETLSNMSSRSALNRYYMTHYGKNIKEKLFANPTDRQHPATKRNRKGQFLDPLNNPSQICRKKTSQKITYPQQHNTNKNSNSVLVTGRMSQIPIPIQQLLQQNQLEQNINMDSNFLGRYNTNSNTDAVNTNANTNMKNSTIRRLNRNSKTLQSPSTCNISSKTYFDLETQNNIFLNLDPNKIIPKVVHHLYINRLELKNSHKTLKQYIQTNLRNIYGNIQPNNTHLYYAIFNKYLALESESQSFAECFIRMLNIHAPVTYQCDMLRIYLIILDKCGSQGMVVDLEKAVMIINYVNRIFYNQKEVENKVKQMQSGLMIISMNNLQKSSKKSLANSYHNNNMNKLTNLTINLNQYFLMLEGELREMCLCTQFYRYCKEILPENEIDLNFQQILEIVKFLPLNLDVQVHVGRLRLYLLKDIKQKDQNSSTNIQTKQKQKQKQKQSQKLSAMKLHKLSLYTYREKWTNILNITTTIEKTFKSTMQFNLSLEQLIDLLNRLDVLEFGDNKVRNVCPWLYGMCRSHIRRYKDYGIKLSRTLLMNLWLTQVQLRVDSLQILGQKLQHLYTTSRKHLAKKQLQLQTPPPSQKTQTQKQKQRQRQKQEKYDTILQKPYKKEKQILGEQTLVNFFPSNSCAGSAQNFRSNKNM